MTFVPGLWGGKYVLFAVLFRQALAGEAGSGPLSQRPSW